MTEQIQKTDTNDQAGANKKPKKSIFRRVLCVISAVIFLPVLFVLYVLASESGSALFIQITDKLLDDISIRSVSGRLQQGLVLGNVQVRSAGVDVQVEEAKLQLDFACLWQRKICIEEIVIKQPTINIDTELLPVSEVKNDDINSSPLRRITLPLSIQVKNTLIENVILAINANQMKLAHFQTAVQLDNENGLILFPTQINDFTFVITTLADETKQTKIADKAPEIDWMQLEQRLTSSLLGHLTAIELPFDIHIQNIQGNNWRYQKIVDTVTSQDIHVESFQVQANTVGYLAQLQKLHIESSLGHLQAEGKFQLNEHFPLNLTAHAELAQLELDQQVVFPKSIVELSLSGSLKEQLELLLQTKGALEFNVTGQFEPNREKTPFQVILTSQLIKYPFVAENNIAPLHIQDINLNLSGDLLNYHLQLNGQAEGMEIPKSQLTLKGNGGISHINIEKIQLKALEGALDLSAELDWKQGIQWQGKLDFNNINIGAYNKSWPAILSGKLISSGQVDGQNWLVNIPEIDIQGILSKRTLMLKGALTASKDKLLDIPQLQLNYGDNKVVLWGQLNDYADFNLDINAPNLRGFLPDLSASLIGKVNLLGNITNPEVKLELTGNNIQFQDLRLNKLYAKGNVNMAEQVQGRIDLELTGFKYGDINVSRADLWLTGREQNHQFHLRATGEPVAAVFNLYGNFDRTSQIWQGVLNQIDIKSPIGRLVNDKNININYDNKQLQATVSSHCWNSKELDFCFPQAFNAGKTGDIPFEIKRLNLDLINKLAEQNGLLEGVLRSQGKVAWFADKPVQLDLRVDGDNIVLAKKIDYRTFKLDISKVSLTGQVENNNLSLNSDIQLARQARINTELKLQDIVKARKLSGSLNIRQLNLNLINQLLSNGENITGEVVADLNLGGDLSAPLLNGSFNITEIQAEMKSLPFDLNNGEIKLNFSGKNSTLQGYIQTPDSRLTLEGDAAWRDLARWNARINAKTEQFSLDLPSMAKLKVNSDVTLRASPDLLQLSGEVAIPWARIMVESLPESAVLVSQDEVILDGQTNVGSTVLPTRVAAKTKSDMAIESNLNIRIGNDVTVSAYGLNSHLQGLLLVKQEKGNLGVYGQITLQNGRYASFGQDLLIRKGEISFSGLPSQPFLNIEAIRNPEAMDNSSITAGVKVIGLADSPDVTIFSEPSMPQDQALSYILTGTSLESSGDSGSSGSIGAALLGLGLGKSGKLVGGIGETFGIQDLNLATAGVGDNSKVVVSGRITPRLEIKYGVGLFDGLAEVIVRYKLIPQLYLQSISGVNQAFDILYQFDF